MKDQPKKILGIDGLSKYLDVSRSTLYKLAQEGKLPGNKVGKRWRFRKETVDKWLDDGQQSQPKEENNQ